MSTTELRVKASSPADNPLVPKTHNFKETEAERPDFDHSNAPILVTKSPNPN